MNLKSFEEMKKTSAFFMLKPANAIYGFIIAICISFFIILIWSIFAPMDDVVKVSVILRTEAAVSSIKCITGGELAKKNYINDQFVKEGDLLFSLDTTAYQKELETFQLQLSIIEQDIFINDTLLQTINTDTFPKLEKHTNAYIKSAAYMYEKQRLESVIDDSKKLLEREKAKPESLRIPQVIQDLESRYNQNQLSFYTWKNNQLSEVLSFQKQLNNSKNTMESRIVELNRIIKNATINAPITGRIIETLKLNNGDYVLAGEEIIKIVPDNSSMLKAALLVDPAYVARVKVGNLVKIKFPGLPPSRYGQIETSVSIVPPDVDLSTGQPVFIVEAPILEDFLISTDGQIAQLIPGITAEGRIITERSTVMRMLLRKLDFIN